jgi:hypothetical protein
MGIQLYNGGADPPLPIVCDSKALDQRVVLKEFRYGLSENTGTLPMDNSNRGKSDQKCVAYILIKTTGRFSSITSDQVQLAPHLIHCPG